MSLSARSACLNAHGQYIWAAKLFHALPWTYTLQIERNTFLQLSEAYCHRSLFLNWANGLEWHLKHLEHVLENSSLPTYIICTCVCSKEPLRGFAVCVSQSQFNIFLWSGKADTVQRFHLVSCCHSSNNVW